jgi:putative endonuclease
MWYVYILECADGTLYTGITNSLERRVTEHNESNIGAKYTRARRPVRLIKSFAFPDRSTAAREEARIKGLSREEKKDLIRKS